jgi:ABC-type nitrate/sulfonate/bicarbonate transport system substrate-binding protein
MPTTQTRRSFLTTLSMAGAARLVRPAVAAEALETTTVRLVNDRSISTREYVRKHPIATKRVLRAVLKATDLCVTEPAQVARRIVDGGFTAQYDYASATLSEVPYDRWRDYDAEDTMRFYALRLHDAGMIKSSPQKIIAEGTDWRFFNELKRELKA